MKQAKINQLKNQLSYYLNYVRRGERVRVYDRDLAIADLVPIAPQPSGPQAENVWIKTLESAGVIKPSFLPLKQNLLATPPGNKKSGDHALRLLLEEREDE